MKHQTFREYLNDIEPKVSATSLASTVASFTPVAPIAIPIAVTSNLVGAGIDVYQSYDDLKNKNYLGAGYNALSAILSLYGAKIGTKFLQNANGKKILLSKETIDKLRRNAQRTYNKVISSNLFLPTIPDIVDIYSANKEKQKQEDKK